MAGSCRRRASKVVLTPVLTCAHPWGLRNLTEANFILSLRVMGFDRGI
jgi:hypothetical protein